MTPSRREFLGTVTVASLTGLSCGGPDAPADGEQGPGAGVVVRRALEVGDPLGVRSSFPVTREGVYLDNAYITPSPDVVVEAGQAFLAAKASGPVSLGEMLAETDRARERFASLIGASVSEVGMLYATSDGENIVSRALELGPDDNVVIDDLHYETTHLLYQELARTTGVELRRVESVGGGAPVSLFARHVDDRTRLVSVAWISHENGYHHDLGGLAELAHAHGAYLYADAIQGLGMLDLDVRETGVDFLTAGTYKWLLGGYGVAPFFVREALLDLVGVDRFGSLHVSEDLGGYRYRIYRDARKYGYATFGFGAVYQLSAALAFLGEVGIGRIEGHTVALAHRLRAGLLEQGYPVWTPADNRSAIVTFDHGRDVGRVRSDLDAAGVKVSLKREGTQIRAGIALFNNEEDVRHLLDVTAGWV